MKLEIKVPAAGESVTEADIARWFKDTGDYVLMDEPLLELETDKASLEVAATDAGVLEITEPEGSNVKIGQVIGYVDTAAAAPETAAADEPSAPEAPAPDASGAASRLAATAADEAVHSTTRNLEMPSPAARKLLAENNASAMDVKGTGKGGRITKADVLRFLEGRGNMAAVAKKSATVVEFERSPQTAPAAAAPKPAVAPAETAEPVADRPVRREKMTRLRRTIATRLVNAQQAAALLTTFNEVDMSAIVSLRKQYKDAFKERYNVGLGFMSFFTKAVCQALLDFPLINASVDGEDIVFHDYCDIGIAVSTPKGLVVPVVRSAESLSFDQIEATIVALAGKGRDGSLTMDDLTGGTFTITNGGVFGSMLSTPIVNAPQSAILGMHNIVERPVARNGEVVIAPVMYIALTYDHRIIDGADAVRFLVRVKEQAEDPARLMLRI